MAAVNAVAAAAAATDLAARLAQRSRKWLVTGAAGFIGSHLVEALLRGGQQVTGLDNFATGHRANLADVQARVGAQAWSRFALVEGDITDLPTCRAACAGAERILHQAALGSVPRSLENPLASHASNVNGLLHMLIAAREADAARFVYASSSATYGDHPDLPKTEDRIGRPLSPYAATKVIDEIYADVFGRCYGLAAVGLRYFNVYGPRQDPQGPYAAVIPRWAAAMLRGETCVIHGDGATSRDFCYVANVVQANLRAALIEDPAALGQVYNVALGDRTTLTELHARLAAALQGVRPGLQVAPPRLAPFRPGDVRHSQADIAKARRLLAYEPTHDLKAGLEEAAHWYAAQPPR